MLAVSHLPVDTGPKLNINTVNKRYWTFHKIFSKWPKNLLIPARGKYFQYSSRLKTYKLTQKLLLTFVYYLLFSW